MPVTILSYRQMDVGKRYRRNDSTDMLVFNTLNLKLIACSPSKTYTFKVGRRLDLYQLSRIVHAMTRFIPNQNRPLGTAYNPVISVIQC